VALKHFFAKKAFVPRRPIDVPKNKRPVVSYYAGDKPRNNDPIRVRQTSEKRQTIFDKLKLLPSLLIVMLILVSVVYSTTLTANPIIHFVGGTSPYRSSKEYTDGVQKLLETNILNQNKVTLNTSKVESEILKSFPELDVVKVSLPVIGRRSTVTLHVRDPALIVTNSTRAFVVDSNGIIVSETRQLSSSILNTLIMVQDQSGLEVHIGGQVLTSDSVTFIRTVAAELTAKQLTITGATLPTIPNEVDFKIKDLPYYLKTDVSGDARLQIGAFLAARDSPEVSTAHEYMDLRVEEKVFYK
jgi:hypothetical protein